MEICNNSMLSAVDATTKTRLRSEREKKSLKADYADGDTVTLSAEALALARQMQNGSSHTQPFTVPSQDVELTGTDSANTNTPAATGDTSFAALRRTFSGYMRYHRAPGSTSTAPAPQETAEEITQREKSNLESQVKQLQKQIAEVMASDLPDVAKEQRIADLDRQMQELMGRLQSLRQADTAKHESTDTGSGDPQGQSASA